MSEGVDLALAANTKFTFPPGVEGILSETEFILVDAFLRAEFGDDDYTTAFLAGGVIANGVALSRIMHSKKNPVLDDAVTRLTRFYQPHLSNKLDSFRELLAGYGLDTSSLTETSLYQLYRGITSHINGSEGAEN